MKVFSDEAIAAMEDGSAIVSGAVSIACDPPVLIWGGYGTLDLSAFGGEPEYIGIGDRSLAQTTSAALGGTAQAVTLSLSGVDPDVLPLLDADEVRNARAVFWRLIFDGSGTMLLDAKVFTRGRADMLTVDETIGDTATITLMIEGAARGLGRSGARMRTDADQRLIDATDGGMKRVSYAAEKMLYWGGQKPANAGSALGGISPGGVNVKYLAERIVES